MPEAGVKTAPIRYDLKTCEGGFVELRQLSYNELLERRDGAMLVTQQMGAKDIPATVRFANQWTSEYSFARCIVDHNLEFDGKKIDFSKPKNALRMLDPKIGAEIDALIEDLNTEPDEEDFTMQPSLSSSDSSKEPSGLSSEPS